MAVGGGRLLSFLPRTVGDRGVNKEKLQIQAKIPMQIPQPKARIIFATKLLSELRLIQLQLSAPPKLISEKNIE